MTNEEALIKASKFCEEIRSSLCISITLENILNTAKFLIENNQKITSDSPFSLGLHLADPPAVTLKIETQKPLEPLKRES